VSARGDRIRVLLFGRYADAEFGGLERHVRSLIEALRHDVEYVNLVARRGHADDSWPCEMQYSRSLATVASMPICPGMPFKARRLHREHGFQVAHLHLPDPMSNLAALALPREVRVVLTWHSDIIRQKSFFGLYRPFLETLIDRAAAVIVPTPSHFTSMAQLAELVPQDKRVVVPFGFDLKPYETPHPRMVELRTQFGGRTVFALGRHVYYKGFEYLIGAMAHAPGVRLVLGGSGPLTEGLKDLAVKTGVSDRVIFAGRIAEADLPAYYQACDVFCLPSISIAEAFGIVQVEAMAAGKPIVCCQLDNGVNWVNQHGTTGLAVPPRDERALAAAITRLLEDESLRRDLGNAAARRAAAEFSLSALRAGTLGVYRKALADQVRR